MMLMQIVRVSRKGILKTGSNVLQVATLTGRKTRGGPLSLPKPFPYRTKHFKTWYSFWDNTMIKVSQENAKIIVVEGPIAVGKSAFCKYLAEEFDMFYMPQPSMDEYYVLPNGYDLRQHDHELPEDIRSYDHKNFCVDPFNRKNGIMQYVMMQLKFFQYMNALQHIMNTGQGVVLERSTYSDLVFINAMLENKFLSKNVKKPFYEIKKNTSTFFMAPHLIIYLDISVPVVQERIRTRNYSYEQNSPALTKGYLTSLEKFYKQHYLKQAAEKSEILVYDWTDGGDIDVVVDDIEKLDLDIMRQDYKFTEWWLNRREWSRLRVRFSNQQNRYMSYFYYPFFRVPELFVSMESYIEYIKLLRRVPECRYETGFNYHAGDSIFSILFRSNSKDLLGNYHFYNQPRLII